MEVFFPVYIVISEVAGSPMYALPVVCAPFCPVILCLCPLCVWRYVMCKYVVSLP